MIRRLFRPRGAVVCCNRCGFEKGFASSDPAEVQKIAERSGWLVLVFQGQRVWYCQLCHRK
jgi:hypothetical protein